MSRFRHAVKNRDQHILTLRAACGVLVVFLLVAILGWMRAPSSLTIHNPPDLRSGSTRAWWEVPPSTVYSFGLLYFSATECLAEKWVRWITRPKSMRFLLT
ncbi:integrating conjugative element protein, PFL_4703 family [Klebsiella pneumoniae subsp. ozaenae]|uniref:Integrating conjugative element protein, PFL_4703 family n=1 Tax=Klebsiella pneumoniae subsp. ozaenae TaxID=574 RepID=A0A377Z2L9_KLEPO|nr:integrating conjugative element protein, PFL_4703 family [Klebsiella pneumoniae subsp. ozaenae]